MQSVCLLYCCDVACKISIIWQNTAWMQQLNLHHCDSANDSTETFFWLLAFYSSKYKSRQMPCVCGLSLTAADKHVHTAIKLRSRQQFGNLTATPINSDFIGTQIIIPFYLFIWSLEIHVLWYLEGNCPTINRNKNINKHTKVWMGSSLSQSQR